MSVTNGDEVAVAIEPPHAAGNAEVREKERSVRQHRDTIGADVVSCSRASQVSCEPSALTRVTPPRQSGTKRSPSALREDAFGPVQVLAHDRSSAEMATGPNRRVSFTSAHGNTGRPGADPFCVVRAVRGS